MHLKDPVIAAGQIMRVSDIPDYLTIQPTYKDTPDHLFLNGGSCLIGPDGHYVLSPVYAQ
ncbi:hypothetical protein AB9P05_20775 [Roseivirga sp. BDSF3-8]|uniref:hypothetical protein n=1 Tax=Roseivirga sp. BDSF3-8 TaxID=3241598 RepID=UPI003532059A